MYFAIAYDLWPHLTGRAFASMGLIRAQLWTWFIGMIVLTIPWHWVGILACRVVWPFMTIQILPSPLKLFRS